MYLPIYSDTPQPHTALWLSWRSDTFCRPKTWLEWISRLTHSPRPRIRPGRGCRAPWCSGRATWSKRQSWCRSTLRCLLKEERSDQFVWVAKRSSTSRASQSIQKAWGKSFEVYWQLNRCDCDDCDDCIGLLLDRRTSAIFPHHT